MNSIRSVLFLVLTSTISSNLTQAQQALSGKIYNYNGGPTEVISFDRFSNEKHSWGKITGESMLSIVLEDQFLQKVKKMAEEAQKNAPSGFRINFRTVGETFACTYDEVETEAGNTVVTGLPELTLADEMGNPANGILYAASSKEIADWLYNYGDGAIGPGYYLQFYYLEGPAKAKGDCVLETFTGEGDESYEEMTRIDLDLQAGWNIIRYGIEEVFTSSTGKIYPSQMTVTRLGDLPEDLNWFALKD
ncbi:MAG: hypothetical protein Q8S14_02195 [Algoriphagus sp.]|uniref:hypothetical protein n=1 Tax=Algoriphagus sp. TaxID=1872435 RepID=UPI00273251BA|nr:hypothetical protein [Algoriphagus sp.]MDP3470657.1 hypothetical protein [Algoriphagus sp.]